MKRNAIIRIVLFSIAIVLLVSILAGGLLVNTAFVNMDWSSILQNEWTSFDGELSSVGSVSASEIKNIQIDWAAGSISINMGDVNAITFCETSGLEEKDQMVWSQQGDTLVIHSNRKLSVFGLNNSKSKNLEITVPLGYSFEELEVNGASADIYMGSQCIASIDINTASGKCNFLSCMVGSLDVDTASGDIAFSGILEELDLDAASASCSLELQNVPNRIDADMASGDLRMKIPKDSGFHMKLDTLSGEFHTDFSVTKRDKYYICGDESCRITVSAMSGNVIILKTETSAG